MNYKEISTNLPDCFRHDIVYHNEKEKRVNIRCDIKTEEECKLWIEKFSQATDTSWVIRDIESDSFVFSFCAVYICHLSSYSLKNIDKKDGCPCGITFMIKKVNNRSLVNPYIQEGFITLITVSYNHFHSIVIQNECPVFQLEENYVPALYSEQPDNCIDVSFITNPTKSTTTQQDTLKNIIETYRNKGHIIEYCEDPFILVIITPLMQRAQQLPFAKDMVFVDSFTTTSNPPYTVTFILAHCKVKIVPLVLIIMQNNSAENFLKAFTIAKENFGPNSFCGQGHPYAIMTDGSDEEASAVRALWPESNLLICRFQILHPVMKWLQDQKDNSKADKRKLLKMFNQLVLCDSIEEAEKLYLICNGTSETEDAHFARKFPLWADYMNSLWLEREKWCTAYRSYRIRGFHTNNVCKTFVRLYKSFVVSRCREVNSYSLLYHTCEELDNYFGAKLLEIANGRMNSARRMMRSDFKKAELINKRSIQILDTSLFSLPKEGNSEEKCLVDLSLGRCSCDVGKFGAFCQHQAALYLHFHRISPSMPFIPPDERYSMAVLALGRRARKASYLSSFPDDEEKNYNLYENLRIQKYCSAYGCEVRSFNISEDQKKLVENGIILSFYEISQKNRNIWIEAAKIPKQLLRENNYLCSLHFTNYCFDLNNELHEDAVPTIFFSNFSSYVEELLKPVSLYDFIDGETSENKNDLDTISTNLTTSKNQNDEVSERDAENESNNILFVGIEETVNPPTTENENQEIVGYNVNSPLEDYDGIIACEEIVVAEVHSSDSDSEDELSKSNPQNKRKRRTLNDLIVTLQSIENASSQKNSFINSSFKKALPRLLNSLKNTLVKHCDNSPCPSVYIMAGKLDPEETDLERRTVVVSPVEAVFVVNDMLKSFKVGNDNFANSQDISLLYMDPVIVSMKYVTLKNAHPSTNCIYIITTEHLKHLMNTKLRMVIKNKNCKKRESQKAKKREEKEKKRNVKISKKKNPFPLAFALAEEGVYPECNEERLKRLKCKKEIDIDELRNFEKGQKWYVKSLKNELTLNEVCHDDDTSVNDVVRTNSSFSSNFKTDSVESDLKNTIENVQQCEPCMKIEIASFKNQNSSLNCNDLSSKSNCDLNSHIILENIEENVTLPLESCGKKLNPSLNNDSSSLHLNCYDSQNSCLNTDDVSPPSECHLNSHIIVKDIEESDISSHIIVNDIEESDTSSHIIVNDIEESDTSSHIIVKDIEENDTISHVIVKDIEENDTGSPNVLLSGCLSNSHIIVQNVEEINDISSQLQSYNENPTVTLSKDSSSLNLDRYISLVESDEDTSKEYDDRADIEQSTLLSEIKVLEVETFSELEHERFLKEIQIPEKMSPEIVGIENIVMNAESKNVKKESKKRKSDRIVSQIQTRSSKMVRKNDKVQETMKRGVLNK